MRMVCFFGRWLWPVSMWLQRAFVANGWTIALVTYVVSQIIMSCTLVQYPSALLVVLAVNGMIDYPVFSQVARWAKSDQELGRAESTALVDLHNGPDTAALALGFALVCAPIAIAVGGLGQISYLVVPLTSWALRYVAYVWAYGPMLPPEDRVL